MQQMPWSISWCGSMAAIDRPSSSIAPDFGRRKPQMVLITVDFPAPFRPISPLTCPACTWSETSRSTSMSWA
jgi:hypothetical protein